jgi:hypothetical protein
MLFTKIQYGLKKFMLYLIVGCIAANIFIPIFPMIFGFPAMVLTALFLTTHDIINKNDEVEQVVFTTHTKAVLIYLFATIFIVDVLILLFVSLS